MTPTLDQLIIRDDVLYVPAWEWNSDEPTLLGHHVVTQVKGAAQRSETERSVPTFDVMFDNGWVVSLALLFAASPAPNEWVSGMIAGTVYPGYGSIVTDGSAMRSFTLVPPTQFIPIIEEVAIRPRRTSQRYIEDALIAAHIESSPHYAGEGEYRLKVEDGGVPVWAIVGAMTETGDNAGTVARDYGVPREAIVAAWSFYQRHREAIDARLAENDAA